MCNRNYNNLLEMFVNESAQRNMINTAIGGRDKGSDTYQSNQSSSRNVKELSVDEMLLKSETDDEVFNTLFAETKKDNKEKENKSEYTEKKKIDRSNRDDYKPRKRSRSRSRSRSREYRNYMATIELSISSDDLYWKVTIICVILGNMLLCEHFISNALVKM